MAGKKLHLKRSVLQLIRDDLSLLRRERPCACDGVGGESDDIHRVLGVTIQSNLKWDLHINEVVAKASKRLHILRVLKRSGVPPANPLKVYFALIRSVSCVA